MSHAATDINGRIDDPTEAVRYFDSPRGIAALWIGLLAGPAAWFLHLNVSYSLVRKICETGDVWLLHLTSLVLLVPAIAGILVAWRSWRRLNEPKLATGAGTLGRSRFMALGGLGLSGFFTLILIVAWIPDFVIQPCVLQ